MKRFLLVSLLLALPVAAAPAGRSSFFTDRELSLIDDALALLNMTRKDLGFDKLVLEDEWRLPVVDRTLSHPLEAADTAMDWAEKARETPEEILAAAAETLGLSVAPQGPPLTAAEKERLVRWAYAAMIEEDSHDGLYAKPEGKPDPEEMLALAKRADRASMIRLAREKLAALPGIVDRVLAGEAVPGVVVAGKGDDVHDLRKDPPQILIDLGGNDRYLAPARAVPGRPLAVVVDLGGNDVYGDGESLSAGAGFFGVGILWDRGDGDDLYLGGHLSQGCGLFGVGVLVDEGGSDVYRCRDTGQGAGAFGVGLLLDRGEGNDSFHADLFGQGFAYVGGLGLLHNEKGQDVYEAGGVHLHYPLFNDRYQSLSQGFSIGMRPYASGGVGLLVDDAGNDRYACDIYGQGASYWFSYGALVDRAGNDTYTLGQYGQGGGIHLAVGCLIDLAGQDLYYNMHGVGTGGAHDFAVGILVDRAGDDYYAGSGGTMGGALTNSFALLLDGGGDDGYSAVKGRYVEGGGRAARGMGSIGLFLDLAGKDLHGTREANGTVWTKETYGAGIDLPDAPPPKGAPPARPHLTPEESEARVRKEAYDEVAGRYDLEKLWDLSKQWAVGEMADVVPVARKHLAELGEPALRKALSRVGTRDGLEERAVAFVLHRAGEKVVPDLTAMLREEEPRRRGYAARYLADLKAEAALPAILPLLEQEGTELAALDAVGRLGDRAAWPAVAKLLAHEKERVRVAAVRCLGKLHVAEAAKVLAGRLAGKEMFTVRFAAEDELVKLREAALPVLLPLAREGKDLAARRHAIRALGRMVLDEGEPYEALTALLNDPDWRIRYDAAGALGNYAKGTAYRALAARARLTARLGAEENPYVKARLTRLAGLPENRAAVR